MSWQLFKHEDTSADASSPVNDDLSAVPRDGWTAYQTLLPNMWEPARLRNIDIN